MNPHLSVSIIIFYISIAVGLFLVYAKPEGLKKGGMLHLGGCGVVAGFAIGSFLFINVFAVKLLLASLPITALGIVEDIGKGRNRFLKFMLIFISSMLGALFTYSAEHAALNVEISQPVFILVCATLTVIFIYLFEMFFVYSKSFLKWLIPVLFVLSTLFFHKMPNRQAFEVSLLIAVSSSGALLLDFPFKKILFGKTGLYFSSFVLAEMLIFAVSYV